MTGHSATEYTHTRYRIDPRVLPKAGAKHLIAYWANDALADFLSRPELRRYIEAGVGSQTGANQRFVRYWFEVSYRNINQSGLDGLGGSRWTPATKGGEFRRWYDPSLHVMDWRDNGEYLKRHSKGAVIRNSSLYFRDNLSWTKIGTRDPSFRFSDSRFVHNDASCFVVSDGIPLDSISAYLNSRAIASLVKELNPTLNLRPSTLLDFPFVPIEPELGRECREISQADWDRQELSLDFAKSCLARQEALSTLPDQVHSAILQAKEETARLAALENRIERAVSEAAGLPMPSALDWTEHSLLANPAYRWGPGLSESRYLQLERHALLVDLISYSVGCMFGRYSLDEPGLILADQGATLKDYLERVPQPSFMPDADNVIPIVGGDWFEDDIVERFRRFLRAAFGEEHFEANLQFVTQTLGVRDIRDYFVKSFYTDHVKRYKNRPIYWMFSSPKGSFNALINMHRYTPSTVSTVLNEYLREYQAKLRASLESAERSDNAREADRLRKVLVELSEYEHEVLYPLASQNVAIDLDDGVKVNYPKLGAALKKVKGLEASNG